MSSLNSKFKDPMNWFLWGSQRDKTRKAGKTKFQRTLNAKRRCLEFILQVIRVAERIQSDYYSVNDGKNYRAKGQGKSYYKNPVAKLFGTSLRLLGFFSCPVPQPFIQEYIPSHGEVFLLPFQPLLCPMASAHWTKIGHMIPTKGIKVLQCDFSINSYLKVKLITFQS